MRIARTLLAAGTLLLPLVSTPAFADRTYSYPTVNGNYGVDICLTWGADCGKPAADAYCASQGMGPSTDYAYANDSPPTWVMGQQVECTAAFCDRFSSITCNQDLPPLVIDEPVRNGYAVDICLTWGENCGKPAADAYCAANDWGTAVNFTIQYDSPPTWVMGQQVVCNEGFCDRFSSISCTGG